MADTPKITKRGLLDRPHPIRNRGDLNRARVLPLSEVDRSPAEQAAHDAAPKHRAGKFATPDGPRAIKRDRSLDQPKSGFDYVRKRNAASRSLSGGR